MAVMRYQAYDWACKASGVANRVCDTALQVVTHRFNPFSRTLLGKVVGASLETAYRATKRYDKLGFNFEEISIAGKSVPVHEEVVSSKPFCDLLHFRREGMEQQPKVLVVAALSGHYATLVKGTIEAFLPDHDVYVTDWRNAREVPLSEGSWGFDEYVTYLIEFLQELGPNTHLLGLCQGTVQSLVAAAVMAERNDACAPASLTLMAGPVDVRVNPGVVMEMTKDLSVDWFRRTMIMTVPTGYPGEGRKVYPGFVQLNAFISLNPKLHLDKHFEFFKNIVFGRDAEAEAHRQFYDEYMAVMDSSAEFYLETLDNVFFEHLIPRGKLKYEGKLVDFSAVKKTALMTVEGEKDEMCTLGQTEAAHTVCSSIPADKRKHHIQSGVGHYGVFSGSKFRKSIAPTVKSFMAKHAELN